MGSRTLPSFVVGMPANDSVHLKHGHDGQIGPMFQIPKDETWTLTLLSEQFYSPYEHRADNNNAIDRQGAMWHLVVTQGNQDVNIHTALLRIQQDRPIDGLAYYEYRNTSPHYTLTGPLTVRTYAYNLTSQPVIFYVGMVWARRQDG